MNTELKKLLDESSFAWKAMKDNPDCAAEKRMSEKTVHKSKLLSSMETKDNFEYVGPGTLTVSDAVSMYDTTSLKLDVPTTLPFKPENHRSYTRANVVFKGNEADWSEYNRVSVWVYPDCPGSKNVWLSLSLVNGGDNAYPREKRFEGVHHINVPNKKWSKLVWEIPYIPRDCVSALMIGYNIHGSHPDMANRSVIFFNKLELSLVDAEHYEGWELNDRIAFCHSGYRPQDKKTAVAQNVENFEIIDFETGATVYNGNTKPVVLDGIKLSLLDFTDFKTEGRYCIRTAVSTTKPFYIASDCYDSPVWKIINFFMQERCGFDLPGSHTMCHMDSFCEHPDGRKILAAGGWHDAGDMSQGLGNTGFAVHAMLDMADKVRDDKKLFERLLDEARWGLSWMMRTRFGDGFRCMWTTIGLWTKNIVGDIDDLNGGAYNAPGENASAAGVEAVGARMFKGIDDEYADYCLNCAIEDYEFAVDGSKLRAFVPGVPAEAFTATGQENNVKGGSRRKRFGGFEIMLNGKMAVAAMELYRTTGDERYLNDAIEYADIIMQCQQTEYTDWDVPMRGFFYSNRTKKEPVAFFHQGHEHVFIQPLSMLVRYAPADRQKTEWKRSLELFSEYIKKTCEYIQPYGLMPAAIYRVAETPEECAGCILHSLDGEAAVTEYNNQVRNGIKLSEEFYLRRFPVAYSLRGFFGVLMAKAKAVSQTALALGDDELLQIAKEQAEWILGKNPFARSYMYGEGYDYTQMYTEFMFDMVGEIPVGIQTEDDHDLPFMPVMNAATYYEVWVNSTAKFLWTLADLY